MATCFEDKQYKSMRASECPDPIFTHTFTHPFFLFLSRRKYGVRKKIISNAKTMWTPPTLRQYEQSDLMSAFNRDNSRPESWPSCLLRNGDQEGQIPGSGTSPPFGTHTAYLSEAVSPSVRCLHLNRSLRGWPHSHGEGGGIIKDSHGGCQVLGVRCKFESSDDLPKIHHSGNCFSLLEGYTWSGLSLFCPRQQK